MYDEICKSIALGIVSADNKAFTSIMFATGNKKLNKYIRHYSNMTTIRNMPFLIESNLIMAKKKVKKAKKALKSAKKLSTINQEELGAVVMSHIAGFYTELYSQLAEAENKLKNAKNKYRLALLSVAINNMILEKFTN